MGLKRNKFVVTVIYGNSHLPNKTQLTHSIKQNYFHAESLLECVITVVEATQSVKIKGLLSQA